MRKICTALGIIPAPMTCNYLATKHIQFALIKVCRFCGTFQSGSGFSGILLFWGPFRSGSGSWVEVLVDVDCPPGVMHDEEKKNSICRDMSRPASRLCLWLFWDLKIKLFQICMLMLKTGFVRWHLHLWFWIVGEVGCRMHDVNIDGEQLVIVLQRC